MKNHYKFLLLAALLVSIISSCTDTVSPDPDAKLVTVNEVQGMTGYLWFKTEYDLYQPDAAIVDQIRQNFDNSKHELFFFVKPACTCELSQEPFPHIMKVLDAAGIPESKCVIYSMSSVKSKCPLSERMGVNKLPSIFVAKDTVAVFSVMDAFNSQKGIDSTTKIEQVLLEGLKK